MTLLRADGQWRNPACPFVRFDSEGSHTKGRITRFPVRSEVILLVLLLSICFGAYAPLFVGNDNSGFDGHEATMDADKGFVASSGTWVIEDETVIIANTSFVHEGNVVVRGTGRLLLENATLNLRQITSWQFSIRLQDSAVFSLTNSRLKTVYPYRVTLSGASTILTRVLSAPFVALHTESTMISACLNTSLLEVTVSAASGISLHMCQVERVIAAGESHTQLSKCDVGVLRCYDQSTMEIQGSTVDATYCDANSMVSFENSTLGPTWCWFSSNLSARECDITTLQYYDSAVLSVFDSSIDRLIGAGSAPIVLDSLSIRDITLTGLANASLIRCVSESILCDWHSTLRFINGSCSQIQSLDWADVSVIGAPTVICNITSFGAYADTSSHISWAAFDTIELGHRTRTWINDSSAYTLFNWAYDGVSPLYMFRCVIDWELRLAWGVQGTIMNSTADNVLVYGDSSLNASGCQFWRIGIGDVDDASIYDCRIEGLFPGGDVQIHIVSSNVSCGIQPNPRTSSVFDSLPVGFIGYWNALDSGSIQGLMWNLTIVDSTIDWQAILRYDSIVEFRNCTLSRLASGESCTVLASNMSIDELMVSGHSIVTLSNGTARNLDCELWSISTFTNMLISDVFTIGNSEASFYNCTIDASLAGGASRLYFEDCEIDWHRASGGSSSTITGSTLGNFSSYDASNNYGYTTVIADLLICGHVSVLKLSECVINSAYVGNTAVAQFYNCSIGSLTTTAYAESLCTESSIDSLECRDASIVVFSGNLTGIESYSITGTSNVIRQLEVIVTDSAGQRIEGALVEIYDSDDIMLVQSWTSSEGIVRFEIIFTATYASLMQTFSLNVSRGGSSYVGQFAITDPIPISVVLDSPPLPTVIPDSGYSSMIPSDESGDLNTSGLGSDELPSARNPCYVADDSWDSQAQVLLLTAIGMALIVQNCAVIIVTHVWPVQILMRTGVIPGSIAKVKVLTHHILEG